MIFKLEFTDRTEFAQAKSLKKLHDDYAMEYGEEEITNIKTVLIIEEEEAKAIMLTNTDTSTFDECPEISLYDLSCGDDFVIIGSTEWQHYIQRTSATLEKNKKSDAFAQQD